MKLLEIAASRSKGPNWTIIRDIKIRGGIVHDMTNLPIPDIDNDTFDGVYSEHFIEHLTKQQGIDFLKEMFRIMKPGSTIRTVWPSMDMVNRLNENISDNDKKFADMYNRLIMTPERVFHNPYYRQYGTIDHFESMEVTKRAAFRLIHQEGEHKHLWYVQELIECMKDIGFVDVQEMQYRVSNFSEFNNIDSKEEMRTLHSSVVEARK